MQHYKHVHVCTTGVGHKWHTLPVIHRPKFYSWKERPKRGTKTHFMEINPSNFKSSDTEGLGVTK